MSETLRTRIMAEARAWIGTPYHHQASVKGAAGRSGQNGREELWH